MVVILYLPEPCIGVGCLEPPSMLEGQQEMASYRGLVIGAQQMGQNEIVNLLT